MTNKTFITAFVLASALAPALATAAPSNGMETTVAMVRTADLNLASAEGRATLGSRITGAVDRVCGAASGTVSIEERRIITACRAKARTTALAAAKVRADQTLALR
jgi:UrcA family protein